MLRCTLRPPSFRKVVIQLQVEPEMRRTFERALQRYRHLGGYTLLTSNNAINMLWRVVESACQLALRPVTILQVVK